MFPENPIYFLGRAKTCKRCAENDYLSAKKFAKTYTFANKEEELFFHFTMRKFDKLFLCKKRCLEQIQCYQTLLKKNSNKDFYYFQIANLYHKLAKKNLHESYGFLALQNYNFAIEFNPCNKMYLWQRSNLFQLLANQDFTKI